MKKPLFIGLAGMALLLLIMFGMAISFYNGAVKLENSVKAQWGANQNEYDSYWKTITEMAQIPDKYKEDFKDVLVGNTEARYGADGSNAQMQWIQEHAVNFDSSLYKKMMTAIEAGRDDFAHGQDVLLSKKEKYSNHLQGAGGAFWTSFFDFPKALMGKDAEMVEDNDGDGLVTVLDYPIVTSKKTKKAFTEGEDEALDVFGKKD